MTGPLYKVLAEKLRGEIRAGAYPPGSTLPTELELCARFEVSRHTAREALRLLQEDGLIARRRGAGTTVVRAPAVKRFAQTLGGVQDLLQYAREARLVVDDVAPLDPSGPQGAVFGLPSDERWLLFRGVRTEAGAARPIAVTRIAVRVDLAPDLDVLNGLPGALNEWIAAEHGVRTGRIEQEIAAVALDAQTAAVLGEDSGAPALQTLRRYADRDGRVFQASLSIHPGDRFIYAMTLERTD